MSLLPLLEPFLSRVGGGTILVQDVEKPRREVRVVLRTELELRGVHQDHAHAALRQELARAAQRLQLCTVHLPPRPCKAQGTEALRRVKTCKKGTGGSRI